VSLCPIHGLEGVSTCPFCVGVAGYVTRNPRAIQYLNLDEPEIINYGPEWHSPPIEPPPPPKPKAELPPEVKLADLADEIDMAERKWRIAMWELGCTLLLAGGGLAMVVMGLWLDSTFLFLGIPAAIGGIVWTSFMASLALGRYLKIWEAKADFARAQRRAWL
jgi:hypothetical protein